jgi:DNA-binding MarR family transcriptional regulator
MSDGRLGTRFGGPETSPGFLLWQVTNRWQAAQRRTLEPFGITHVQFVILAWLTWAAPDEPVTQQELADAAALDKMMTSQVLRTLEHKGLVERRRDPRDGRARLITVNDTGKDLAGRANTAVESCDVGFFGALGDDQAELVPLLQRLAGADAGPETTTPPGQEPRRR